jgi:hypothetical protein
MTWREYRRERESLNICNNNQVFLSINIAQEQRCRDTRSCRVKEAMYMKRFQSCFLDQQPQSLSAMSDRTRRKVKIDNMRLSLLNATFGMIRYAQLARLKPLNPAPSPLQHTAVRHFTVLVTRTISGLNHCLSCCHMM